MRCRICCVQCALPPAHSTHIRQLSLSLFVYSLSFFAVVFVVRNLSCQEHIVRISTQTLSTFRFHRKTSMWKVFMRTQTLPFATIHFHTIWINFIFVRYSILFFFIHSSVGSVRSVLCALCPYPIFQRWCVYTATVVRVRVCSFHRMYVYIFICE